jgi:H+/Cl- antiporter ClcA
MFGLARNRSTVSRWRPALRAGAMAAALAVIAGAPLAAQAHEWDHGRGHERREWREHEWREHHHAWGYYAPAPAYGYYAPGYGYYAPGASLNFTIR